jgi:hypothetical protein
MRPSDVARVCPAAAGVELQFSSEVLLPRTPGNLYARSGACAAGTVMRGIVRVFEKSAGRNREGPRTAIKLDSPPVWGHPPPVLAGDDPSAPRGRPDYSCAPLTRSAIATDAPMAPALVRQVGQRRSPDKTGGTLPDFPARERDGPWGLAFAGPAYHLLGRSAHCTPASGARCTPESLPCLASNSGLGRNVRDPYGKSFRASAERLAPPSRLSSACA